MYYFASDVHLGLQVGNPREREQRFVAWLTAAAGDAKAIYLLGDIFDFWCEYKTVVPKGYTRTLGKLAELADSGIEIHFFPGNHDLWTFGYLAEELGLIVHHEDWETTIAGKRFYLAHGDNTGRLPKGFRLLRGMFTSPFFQRMFSAVHPRWGVGLANTWSQHSRLSKGLALPFMGDKEQLYNFAKEYSRKHPVDYFIFGHRHLPLVQPVNEQSTMVYLGEWIEGTTYAVFDGRELQLKQEAHG